ncbi:MAG: PorT family protein [Krumholzibacteria bacterium]|nr:PorT family protein [Candidatus Krumholzibacteria bacterium]
MKRLTGLFIVMAIVVGAGSAAAQGTGLVGKGIKAGLAYYTFTGADKEIGGVAPDLEPGLAVGAFVTLALGPGLDLQPEILYVQKGAQYESNGYTFTFDLDYLEIPILLKYRLGTGGGVRPSLFAGPAFAIKLKAEGTESGPGGSETVDYGDQTNALDVGLAFGAGLGIPAGANLVTFDARYTLGLTDWPDPADVDEELSMKNSGWLVMAGITF